MYITSKIGKTLHKAYAKIGHYNPHNSATFSQVQFTQPLTLKNCHYCTQPELSFCGTASPSLSSPGQCSSTAPQATFVCDTKAHSHPRKWHMHGCRCCFTSCLLKYEAISCEWCMVRESGRLGEAQLCCSLWYCQGRIMALCSNSHHQTNVVWLWFSLPMHYHHSE